MKCALNLTFPQKQKALLCEPFLFSKLLSPTSNKLLFNELDLILANYQINNFTKLKHQRPISQLIRQCFFLHAVCYRCQRLISLQWIGGTPDIQVVGQLSSLVLIVRIGGIGIACRPEMVKVHFFVCFLGYAGERETGTVKSQIKI